MSLECRRCRVPVRFAGEDYHGWHRVRLACPNCQREESLYSSFPRCPMCGTPLHPRHRHTGGDNGLWVDDGYECREPRCPGIGTRVWTRSQLEGFYRARTRPDKRARAEERRQRRAERLRAQMGERT